MNWNKIKRTACWLLHGRNEMECLFCVLDKCKRCEGCEHNEWGSINE